MKIQLLLLSIFSTSSFAFATGPVDETVYYCGESMVEGAYFKVEPHKNRMCLSSGQFSADYCDRPGAQVLDLVRISHGKIEFPQGKEFSFKEFVGKSADKSQLVRVYAASSNPSGMIVRMLWAELMGSLASIPNTKDLSGAAEAGDPECVVANSDSVF